MCPTPPYIVCSPVSLCILGDSCRFNGQNPLYVGRLGGVSTSVRLLVSVNTSLGCPLCSSCTFHVVNMSQVSTTTATTTTPPVTVVSSGMSSISSVTVAPSLMGLPTL